jgi:hypothetical protein
MAISALIAAALSPSAARAVLAHRYTFSGNANDSVGTAHGTLVNGGGSSGYYLNGQLVVTGNTGQGSNAISADAYVDLPNGVISQSATSGTSGAISLEWWATIGTQRTWQRLGDFGTANGGENVSDGGGMTNYIQITPNSGRYNNGLEMTHHLSTGAEPSAGITGPFPVARQQHVVAVYDKTNTTGGPGGTMSLYLNGALVDSDLIDPAFDLNTLNDNNNWLGRSQWNDPVFDGLFNEFSIYDHGLTAAEVATNFSTGPVGGAVSEPTVTVNPGIRMTGYTIRSNRGALVAANWTPISGRLDAPGFGGNGSFDSDDFWFPSSVNPPASNVLEEGISIDGPPDDGGPLGTTPVGINGAGNRLWRKFFVEDVTAVVQAFLPGGGTVELPAAVNFTGNGGVAWRRSDINFDNQINAADYAIFRDNHRKPIDTMLTDPESYVFGDIDGDQDNDFADFRLFQADYVAANGAAAFAALVGSVPEPASALMIVMMGVGVAGMRRRRRNG